VALAGAIGLPVFVGMALVAVDGVAVVLGPKWLPAAPFLRLLCAPGYVLFLTCTLHPVLNAFGRPDLPAKYNGAYALFMPAAFLLAGRSHGLLGICTAWAVLYPAITAALVHLTRPVLGFGVGELARSQAPACAGALAMAGAVLGVQWCLPGADRAFLRLTLSIATGAAVYPAAVWMLARQTVVRDLRMMLQQLKGKP
jgi:O-antigen/teichoic acid export membrane protein